LDRISLRLDLHVHTRFSRDAVSSLDEINARCRALSFDGYAVCDHDSVGALAEARASCGGRVVVPGLEITARGAHIVCLDPIDVVPSGLSIIETVERIHAQGATAVLAHPYAIPRSHVKFKEAEDALFDAIEVANAAQIPFGTVMGWNRGLAERLGLPQTGGSDSHIPETFGRAYTVVESASRETEDVIESIREGRTSVAGTGIGLGERLVKFWRLLQKS
jgi:predicted metal-dependent phosphoesterase TrpH